MALELPIKPNEAQQEALDALNESRKEGKNKGLVVMATGTGKTITAALDTLHTESKSILFIVHRNEINYQAVAEFSRVRGKDEQIGFVNADLKEFDQSIIFGTVQTLSRPDNLKELASKYFDYFIIDEAHHIAAPSYQRIIKAVKAKFTLGLTATPERLKEGHVKQFFDDNIVFELGLKAAIDKKILVPFIYYGLHDNIDYSDIKWNGHKYNEKDLDRKLIIDKRNEAIVKEFQDHASKRQTIGFCVNIRHADIMANKFNRLGIKAVAITNKTPKEKRAKIIEAFRKREIQAIFTRDIFNEGVDFPNVEALLFLRPTFSQIVFYQQLGRGLRKAEDKNNVLVLDFIGNEHNAYRKVEWLKAVGVPISLEKERAKPKPEYEHHIPQVWFDSEVIDIFQRDGIDIIDSEDLLIELHRLKRSHGIVTQDIVNKFSKYSSYQYKRIFGSLNSALLNANLEINHFSHIPNEELLNDLKRLQQEHGKVTQQIIRKYGRFSDDTYNARFGSMRRAYELADVILSSNYHPRCLDSSLLDDLQRLHAQFGSVTSSIIDKHGKYSRSTYQEHFGSVPNALSLCKIPVLNKKNISKDEAIENYNTLRAILGRTPISTDMKRPLSTYSLDVYYRIWGSWSNFLKEIGEV